MWWWWRQWIGVFGMASWTAIARAGSLKQGESNFVPYIFISLFILTLNFG
jgi:hypothetical protein